MLVRFSILISAFICIHLVSPKNILFTTGSTYSSDWHFQSKPWWLQFTCWWNLHWFPYQPSRSYYPQWFRLLSRSVWPCYNWPKLPNNIKLFGKLLWLQLHPILWTRWTTLLQLFRPELHGFEWHFQLYFTSTRN